MDSDHGSVIAFLDRFADAWKRNDASAAAALFVDDGSLINPFGQRADGHATVQAMYADYFTGMLRGTTTTVVLSSVRGLGAGYAFADAEQTILGPDGAPVLVAHLAALLQRDGDTWRFVDSRPYTFPAPPA